MVNIWRSYGRYCSALFFDSQCIKRRRLIKCQRFHISCPLCNEAALLWISCSVLISKIAPAALELWACVKPSTQPIGATPLAGVDGVSRAPTLLLDLHCYPTDSCLTYVVKICRWSLIIFHVRRSRGEMYTNHGRLCVCLSVPRRIPTLLHAPGRKLGES